MAKRGQNEGTICERSDGRWVASMTLPGGKRKWFYGKTRKEVADKLASALADLQKGETPKSGRLTVGKYLDDWLAQHVKVHRSAGSYRTYEQQTRLHLKPALGKTILSRLSAKEVQELVNRKSAEGYSPMNVRSILGTLQTALSQAERWGLVSRNVARLVTPPGLKASEFAPFTPEEAERFLKAIRDEPYGPLFSTALYLGLRRGEVLALKWADMDLDARTLRVAGNLQRVNGEAAVLAPKTERSRRALTIPQGLVPLLRRQRARQFQDRLLMGDDWPDGDFVFSRPDGHPLHPSTVSNLFTDVLKKHDLPRIRLHDLRHSCASLLFAQGLSPKVVQEVLGHENIATTLNIYTHVLQEQKDEAANVMDRLFGTG